MSSSGLVKIFIDEEDFERLSAFKWNVSHGRKCVQRTYHNGKKTVSVSIGSEILRKVGTVDHIDGDYLNNRKANLREASYSQNMMNRKKWSNTSSIYKGVCFNKKTNKWLASICVNGNQMYLGQFLSEKEAAIAYNSKAIELHKEFAVINNV